MSIKSKGCWMEAPRGSVRVRPDTDPHNHGNHSEEQIFPAMVAIIWTMLEFVLQPGKPLEEALGYLHFPFTAGESFPSRDTLNEWFRDLRTLNRVYHGYTSQGVWASMAAGESPGLYEPQWGEGSDPAHMEWEGHWTPGRWVRLELFPGEAILSWDTGTGRPSRFLEGLFRKHLSKVWVEHLPEKEQLLS